MKFCALPACFLALLTFSMAHSQTPEAPAKGVSLNLSLPPSDTNPRNSEGDFLHLKDGLLLFVYSHYLGSKKETTGSILVSRVSSDEGRTWSDQNQTVLDTRAEGESMTSSVSLLRLSQGRIALFYSAKKSDEESWFLMRISADEAQSWGDSTVCTPGEGSFLVTHGRVIRLKSGRIIFPAGVHEGAPGSEEFHRGQGVCFYSDDEGATWKQGKGRVTAPAKSHSGIQYPALVELKDGRLMMLLSMHLSPLLRAYSKDGGDTWTPYEPAGLPAPIAPASIKRVPSTGDLLLVWNDHRSVAPALRGSRTPLTVAISTDEGLTWEKRKNLYEDPDGAYSFAAVDFAGGRLLVAHTATHHARGPAALATTVISSVDLDWLYQ